MRVLIVCTGNICRSPAIEAAVRHRLPELTISSAGTRARRGLAIHPLTVEAMARQGLPGAGHASRLLDERVLHDVDLVITAERAHRAVVLGLRPSLLRRTFTLSELVALAEATPGGPWADTDEGLEAVLAHRGRATVDVDDLPDPVDAGPAQHEEMVRSVLALVDRLARAVHHG